MKRKRKGKKVRFFSHLRPIGLFYFEYRGKFERMLYFVYCKKAVEMEERGKEKTEKNIKV